MVGKLRVKHSSSPTVQAGAKKLNMKAYPFGHPDTDAE